MRIEGKPLTRTYQVYGVTLASEYSFVSPLTLGSGAPDLHFSCVDHAPGGFRWEDATIVDAQGERADGLPHFVFSTFDGVTAVRLTGAADFYLWRDRIVCHLVDERHRYLVEIGLFGLVLSLWLEQRGVPTFHASGAVINGHAVAFLAARGGGKTSMAAACVAEGHALLTDDLLALDEESDVVFARPGYPMMRLWPEQACRFVNAWEDLPIVHPAFDKRRVAIGEHFGGFAGSRTPLRRLYLPERSDDPRTPVEMLPVNGQEAAVTLVRHSFLPREVQRFGLQSSRLPFIAALSASVPLQRLRYPSGYERLLEVVAAITDDVGRGG